MHRDIQRDVTQTMKWSTKWRLLFRLGFRAQAVDGRKNPRNNIIVVVQGMLRWCKQPPSTVSILGFRVSEQHSIDLEQVLN